VARSGSLSALCAAWRSRLVGNAPRPLSSGLLTAPRKCHQVPPCHLPAVAPDVAVAGLTCCVFRPPLNSAPSEFCESPSARILLNGKTRGIWTAAFKESTSVELLPTEAVCPGLNPSCIGTPGRLLTHPARHNRGCQLLMSPRPPWQGPASLGTGAIALVARGSLRRGYPSRLTGYPDRANQKDSRPLFFFDPFFLLLR
jgi:hypothetical protein